MSKPQREDYISGTITVSLHLSKTLLNEEGSVFPLLFMELFYVVIALIELKLQYLTALQGSIKLY